MFSTIITILMWMIVLLIALAAGRRCLRWFSLECASLLEEMILSLALGLGVAATGIMLLGLAGLFRAVYFTIWLILLALWARNEFLPSLSKIRILTKKSIELFRQAKFIYKIFSIAAILFFLLIFLQALTPVWDYDGLMYHLEAPRRFLNAEKIYLIPEIHQANGPLLIEMLFSLGVAFNFDRLAKIIHFTFSVLVVLAVYLTGERSIGKHKGWIPAGIFISIPFFPLLASSAYVDFAWCFYQYLSLYCILCWVQSKNQRWLTVSGAMAGFAVGSKYISLAFAAIMAVVIFWISFDQGWKTSLRNIMRYGLLLVGISLPWYLKNLILGGNPFYPYFFGGLDWSPERVATLSSYLNSFGTGRGLIDFLLLPINLYTKAYSFMTISLVERPSIFFLLALGYPWVKKTRITNVLAITALLWFLLWSLISQQTRFLLPVFGCASVLSALSLVELSRKIPWQKIQNELLPGLLGGAILASFIYSWMLFDYLKPLSVVIGSETAQSYLGRIEGNFNALQYYRTNINQSGRVLMIWDGRSYYWDDKTVPDTDNYLWTNLVKTSKDISSISSYLNGLGITHILFNITNANYLKLHDPEGDHRKAYFFLLDEFLPQCAQEIYRDNGNRLYEFTCRQ